MSSVEAFLGVARRDPSDCPTCGDDKCEGCGPVRVEGGPGLERAPEPAPRPRLIWRKAADLIDEPAPAAIIAGLAWSGCVTVLVGESGAGKTFLLTALAADVADGRSRLGRRVKGGSVAYVSFEGDAMGLRLRALREYGLPLDNLHVLRAGEPISPKVSRDGLELPSMGEAALAEALADLTQQLAAEGRPPLVLVVIDTIRASLAGNEDSSEDVAGYLRAVRRLLTPFPRAACILAHHAGWQDGDQRRKRERGSSALRGNVDATAYLEATGEDRAAGVVYLVLRTLKARDEERPAPLRLQRRRVRLDGTNEYGEQPTSCVVERDPRRLEELAAAEEERERAAREALDGRAIEAVGRGQVSSIASLRSVLGIGQPVAAEVLARLLAEGRIERGSQREPYRVVPTNTEVRPSTGVESYRTARPKGGTGTARQGNEDEGRKRASRTGGEGGRFNA